MAKLTIDGIPIEVPDGTVLIEACKALGVDVPNFCYYPKLELIGACRMCLVEIKAGPVPPPVLAKPQASCTTTVRGDGWEVLTNSPKVEKLRKGILEFLLLNHSLTCPTCDMGGECELQDNTWRYGPGKSRMHDPKVYRVITSLGPFVDLNMQRCVQCQRCTRYCSDVMGNNALGMEHRSAATQINGFPGENLDCVLCGNCIEVCPVGALTSDQFDTKARQWDRVETTTICTYCGDGCSMKLDMRSPASTRNTPLVGLMGDRFSMKLYGDRGKVLRTRAFLDSGALIEEYQGNNAEFLCHKGRFAFHVVHHPERLHTPLVRRNGRLEPATWAEAYAAAADGFKRILETDGSDALGGIGSDKTTNEESYLFQKFVRTVFGTNNVDHRVSVKDLRTERAPGATQFTIPDLYASRSILVLGPGITEQNPLTESRVRLAVRRNRANLVVAGSRRSLISNETRASLRCKPGTDAALAFALAAALSPARLAELQGGHERAQAALAPEALERATQGGRVTMETVEAGAKRSAEAAQAALAAFAIPAEIEAIFKAMPLERACEIAGVAAADVQAAARSIAGSPATHVILGQDLFRSPGGREAADLLRALTVAFGWPEAAEMTEHNNSRGARDMGVLPDLLPGYRSIGDLAGVDALRQLWGTTVSSRPGLNTFQMLQAAAARKVRGLYLMGTNPAVTFPGGDLVARALERIEFLVVQDVFMTETAMQADVVFPAALWAEKAGTFTNWEGRVQRVRPAIAPPGMAETDDLILGDLARAMNHDWPAYSNDTLLEEMGQASAIYAGLRGADFETPRGEGVLWPRRHAPAAAAAALSVPDLSAVGALEGCQVLWGNDTYHHGSLTGWDEGPRTAEPHAYIEVSPADAAAMGVTQGDNVVVTGSGTELTLPCRVTDDVSPGQVFVPTTFHETPTNRLLDPTELIDTVRLRKGEGRVETVNVPVAQAQADGRVHLIEDSARMSMDGVA